MIHLLALLTGLFVIPALVLWAGHGFHKRGPRTRAIFWGVVAGHSTAAVPVIWVALFPAEAWSTGLDLRVFMVHWGLLAGGGLGGAVGFLRYRSRSRNDESTQIIMDS